MAGMQSVYEAPTALDAYMVLNLLEQQGIGGRVDGEYLPGAVGELQALNLVRVMVDDADAVRARQVIAAWEATQVTGETVPARKSSAGLTGFLLGCIAGGGMMFWAYHSPVTEGGVDTDGDGVLDVRRFYRDNRLSRTESDRNLDGAADAIKYYDRRGLEKAAEYDDDFDGVFEARYSYVDGELAAGEADLDQDGHVDHRSIYRYGRLAELVISGAGADRRGARQLFHRGKLVAAEYDADGDGNYDVNHVYDYFGELR
ncbi:MAG: DUF2007 domain-containing protein [Pseudomonadota bacterium]